MVLVEGISNEVLFAFIVTISFVVIAVSYLFSEGTSTVRRPIIVEGSSNYQSTDRHINNTANVDGSQSETSSGAGGGIEGGGQSETIANSSSRANTTREEVSNLPCNRDLQDENTREDSLRRRVVNDPESKPDQSPSSQDETMVVKVKHNENIQTFNVSKNTTVIELKR